MMPFAPNISNRDRLSSSWSGPVQDRTVAAPPEIDRAAPLLHSTHLPLLVTAPGSPQGERAQGRALQRGSPPCRDRGAPWPVPAHRLPPETGPLPPRLRSVYPLRPRSSRGPLRACGASERGPDHPPLPAISSRSPQRACVHPRSRPGCAPSRTSDTTPLPEVCCRCRAALAPCTPCSYPRNAPLSLVRPSLQWPRQSQNQPRHAAIRNRASTSPSSSNHCSAARRLPCSACKLSSNATCSTTPSSGSARSAIPRVVASRVPLAHTLASAASALSPSNSAAYCLTGSSIL